MAPDFLRLEGSLAASLSSGSPGNCFLSILIETVLALVATLPSPLTSLKLRSSTSIEGSSSIYLIVL